MKTIIICALALTLFASACSQNQKKTENAEAGTPIDSTVIGKDTSQTATRTNIEMSDEEKQTLPGRDTTNTDEPKK